MCPGHNSADQFLSLSAFFTGFTQAELQGTGLAGRYYDVVNTIIDSDIIGTMLLDFQTSIDQGEGNTAPDGQRLIEDPKTGPVIKNIISLWYLGQWNQMPHGWRNEYGASALDRNHIISASSYKHGLVWTAMGAHPMGTKQQGFGAWSLPPPEPLP
jgi:hypothetical protein